MMIGIGMPIIHMSMPFMALSFLDFLLLITVWRTTVKLAMRSNREKIREM